MLFSQNINNAMDNTLMLGVLLTAFLTVWVAQFLLNTKPETSDADLQSSVGPKVSLQQPVPSGGKLERMRV